MSTLTREELNELMRKGWSWRTSGSSGGTSVYIIDKVTGAKYLLEVVNGDLTMSEVIEQ